MKKRLLSWLVGFETAEMLRRQSEMLVAANRETFDLHERIAKETGRRCDAERRAERLEKQIAYLKAVVVYQDKKMGYIGSIIPNVNVSQAQLDKEIGEAPEYYKDVLLDAFNTHG